MTRWTDADKLKLVERLNRYGLARNRDADPEPRTVTITDDDAVMLLDLLHELPTEEGADSSDIRENAAKDAGASSPSPDLVTVEVTIERGSVESFVSRNPHREVPFDLADDFADACRAALEADPGKKDGTYHFHGGVLPNPGGES